MSGVEIVAIGDELLRGIVQETNSHWLAKRIAARGGDLRRVTVLPDDVDVAAFELRAALARAPSLLITHGGLGPTGDDRTREIVARALDRPQEQDAGALAIIERRYAELHASGSIGRAGLGDARARMAMLPRGARAFDNQVGTAPAFAVTYGATTIVSLPGVPPELFWIWDTQLAPLLDEIIGPGGYAETTLELDLRDESDIADLVAELVARHPEVYVKSRARGFESGEEVRLTLSARAASDEQARALVAATEEDARAALDARGFSAR